jgi:predicted small metal-binding protein
MSENAQSKTKPNTPGTNPEVHPQDGGINPSAPTAGTEGWGTTSDERRVLSGNDPAHTRAGQMKGNPGDNQAHASQRASDAASSNKAVQADVSDHQAEKPRHGDASRHSMHTSPSGTERSFRCADVGNSDCQWETSGSTEDEIMERVEEHGRTAHGMADWTQANRNKVRDAIRNRQAA